MKAFNLVALAITGALLLTIAIAIIADKVLGKETAMMVVPPIVILVGMSARITMEKILGYTLYDALKEDSDESSGG